MNTTRSERFPGVDLRTDPPDESEFLERYFHPERPFVIRNYASSWPACSKWKAKSLLDELHRNSAANDRGIFFTSNEEIRAEDYETPEFIRGLLDSSSIMPDSKMIRFWINRKHNKTEFHYDTNAENVITVQVTGTKAWALVSPDTPLPCYPFTNFTILQDENRLLANKEYFRFVLNRGDLLYIPPFWFHSAISLDTENININWTFTKNSTSVISRAFKREVERCRILHALQNSRSAITKKLYRASLRLLPKKSGGIGCGLISYIDSSYTPGRAAILTRAVKETFRVPAALISYPAVRTALKQIDTAN